MTIYHIVSSPAFPLPLSDPEGPPPCPVIGFLSSYYSIN